VLPPEDTRLSASAFLYRGLTIMARVAGVLGKPDDARRYAGLADALRGRFNAAFLSSAKGIYETARDPGYRQTSNVLPLAFGLVPEEQRVRVVQGLVADIQARGGHLNTGILGTRYLLSALTDQGCGDLAERVATQRTYPSWGLWLEQGATTLWEGWELSARSRSHAVLGSIDQWLYEDVAGLRPDEPGFQTLTIRPTPTGDLTRASARTHTPYGEASVAWQVAGDAFTLDVTVPVGTTATVFVPARGPADVTEGGQPAERAQGVTYLRMEGNAAVYALQSGAYSLASAHPPRGAACGQDFPRPQGGDAAQARIADGSSP
jgi:alpha-L-rhamnosidase